MGYINLDNIVRSSLADKGHSTLHKYIPFLHWAFKGLEKLQEEGVNVDIKSTKNILDENNCLPFPEDMKAWCKIGVVVNGLVQVFVNNESLSLDASDHNASSSENLNRGLFTYDADNLNSLYTTNVYVATDKGIVLTTGAQKNSFRVNWPEKKFHIRRPVTGKVYLEYVARVHNPSTATVVNEIAREYIEAYISYREARYTFGANNRETEARGQEWLEAQDDLRANFSNLTGDGILSALHASTRRSIDQ